MWISKILNSTKASYQFISSKTPKPTENLHNLQSSSLGRSIWNSYFCGFCPHSHNASSKFYYIVMVFSLLSSIVSLDCIYRIDKVNLPFRSAASTTVRDFQWKTFLEFHGSWLLILRLHCQSLQHRNVNTRQSSLLLPLDGSFLSFGPCVPLLFIWM